MKENMPESFDQQNRHVVDDKRRSRRNLLGKGIVVAVTALGAEALLNKGTASAQTDIPGDNVGNFSSSNGTTPAVTATGTNGSVGIVAIAHLIIN